MIISKKFEFINFLHPFFFVEPFISIRPFLCTFVWQCVILSKFNLKNYRKIEISTDFYIQARVEFNNSEELHSTPYNLIEDF